MAILERHRVLRERRGLLLPGAHLGLLRHSKLHLEHRVGRHVLHKGDAEELRVVRLAELPKEHRKGPADLHLVGLAHHLLCERDVGAYDHEPTVLVSARRDDEEAKVDQRRGVRLDRICSWHGLALWHVVKGPHVSKVRNERCDGCGMIVLLVPQEAQQESRICPDGFELLCNVGVCHLAGRLLGGVAQRLYCFGALRVIALTLTKPLACVAELGACRHTVADGSRCSAKNPPKVRRRLRARLREGRSRHRNLSDALSSLHRLDGRPAGRLACNGSCRCGC